MKIDWCPKDKVPELQAFIDTYWSRGHILARDADLLCWQYRNSGESDRLAVLVALEDEKIVGFLGCIPVSFSHHGERLPAMWTAMWLVAPDVRSQFVGLKLLREMDRRKFSIVGGLGLNENTGTILPNRGFEVFEVIPRWVRVISPLMVERILAQHPDGYPAEAWQAWQRTAQSSHPPVATNIRLLDWDKALAGRWNQAWQERFAPRLLGTWHDADYLQWRYVDHPRFQYVLRFAENITNGDLVGLLVYRVETVRNREEKVIRIVEFLTEEIASGALTGDVLNVGKELNVAFADFYCTSEVFGVPLEAAGFARDDQMPVPLPRLFQPLDFRQTQLNGAFWVNPDLADDRSSFFRSGSLYVTSADGDQDRPN
jgi:hypothetical protein